MTEYSDNLPTNPMNEQPETLTPVETLDTPVEPTVYGGASPEVSAEVLEEKPREIYGGANPLENTAPIPTVAVNEEAQAVEPAAVEPVAEVPAVEPVVETPAVEPVVEPTVEAPTEVVPEEKKEELEKLEF